MRACLRGALHGRASERKAAGVGKATPAEHVALYEQQGETRKEAMRLAAKDRGVSRRDITRRFFQKRIMKRRKKKNKKQEK